MSKNFGIGAGLKYIDLNLQAQDTGEGAEFDFQFLGPAVFGYATFLGLAFWQFTKYKRILVHD